MRDSHRHIRSKGPRPVTTRESSEGRGVVATHGCWLVTCAFGQVLRLVGISGCYAAQWDGP